MINEYGSLNCKKDFVDDGSLFFFFSYLQPLSKYFQTFTSTDKNFGLKSKGLSEEIINSHAASDNIFEPKLSFMTKKFEEKHLNKAKYQLVKKKGVTFLLLMLLDTWAKDVNTYLIPSDCLFGAVKLTRNADPNKD